MPVGFSLLFFFFLSMNDFLPGCLFAVVIKCFMIGVNVWWVYLAPQNIPRANSVLTLGNKVILYKRGSAERSSLKGRERAIVNHWDCFRGNVGETSERQDGAHNNYGLFRAYAQLELNWTELNWTKRYASASDENSRSLTNVDGYISQSPWRNILIARFLIAISLESTPTKAGRTGQRHHLSLWPVHSLRLRGPRSLSLFSSRSSVAATGKNNVPTAFLSREKQNRTVLSKETGRILS